MNAPGGRLSLGCLAAFLLLGCAARNDQPRPFTLPPGGVGGSSLVVVFDDNYPPYSLLGEAGRPEGIVPDQWRAWSARTGIPVELRAEDWAKAVADFEARRADVLDTVFETPAREAKYDFSPPYATLEVPVFTHKSISGISSLADLRGFRVAAKEGDAAVDQLRLGGVSDVATYPSYEAIIRDAAAQNVRVFTVDKAPALYFLYKYGIDRDYRVAFELAPGQFHRAVRKGDKALLELVEAGFAALPPGRLRSIDEKWMGSDIARTVDLRLLASAGGALVLVVLLLLALAWTLRRRIAFATAELRDKVTQLELSEARTRSALADKEILLKEVHHRVKNNLQVVSSLIELAAHDLRDGTDRRVLDETQERIRAMAQLHEQLYRSDDLSSIEAGDYLRAVVSELALGHGFSRIEFAAEPCGLDLDRAVPLGLIANELVLNALKYAYPAGRPGPLRVTLRREESLLVLEVADEGGGLPPEYDMQRSSTMGLTLVRSLASQLRGSLSFSGPPGLEVRLSFPA